MIRVTPLRVIFVCLVIGKLAGLIYLSWWWILSLIVLRFAIGLTCLAMALCSVALALLTQLLNADMMNTKTSKENEHDAK